MWVAGFMELFRRRPAMDLVGAGGAGFLGWWASRSMEVHRPIWPENGNPRRAIYLAAVAPIEPDSGRFRRWFTSPPVGFGRGGGDASIGTGGVTGGGRTAKFRPPKVRPRRWLRARREREFRGRGERKMIGFPEKETLKTEIPKKETFQNYPSDFRRP